MDSGKQGEANKTKGLRSKRRPRHSPFNAVESTWYSFLSPWEPSEDALLLPTGGRGVASKPDSKSISSKQGEVNKTKGLRSKRRPRHPPFNAVESTVYNFFNPFELDIADSLLMLARARGVSSEPNSKSNMPKMPKKHKCNACGLMFSSGQALGGHKRAHYKGIITYKRKRVGKN